MKKLLIVIEHLPYPLNSGGKKAQFDFIENHRHLLDISITFVLKDKDKKHFEKLCQLWPNITFIPFLVINSKLESLLSLPFKASEIINQFVGEKILSKITRTESDKLVSKSTMMFRSTGFVLPIRFINHFKDILTKKQFDFVQVEFHQLISLAKYVPKHIKKIFVHHELRYVREERELELYSFESSFLNKTFQRNKNYEINSLKMYDLVCTLSETDKKELEKQFSEPKIYSSPIPVVLNGDSISFKFENRLVFLGGEDHFPNKEGLDWFLNCCWNSLKKYQPELKLDVIGNWKISGDAYATQFSDVTFHGFVDDLNKALKNGLVIVPIRIGSGVRIKIIDAVNIGSPFVSTRIGVEGLNFKDGKDCLIGDSPQEFVARIRDIIATPDLGNELAVSAKKTLLSEYAYDSLIEKRLKMYDEGNFK